jgi:hypothetical protein
MDEKKTMSLEQFKDCAVEIIPALKKLREVLKKHDCGNYLRITLSNDGYSCAEGDALAGWSLYQYKENEPYSIKYEYNAKLTIDGDFMPQEVDEDA